MALIAVIVAKEGWTIMQSESNGSRIERASMTQYHRTTMAAMAKLMPQMARKLCWAMLWFAAGFAAKGQIDQLREHVFQAAYDEGRRDRDLEAYRNLHVRESLEVKQQLSAYDYDLQPVSQDRYYEFCEKPNLHKGEVIDIAFEWDPRRLCMSLNGPATWLRVHHPEMEPQKVAMKGRPQWEAYHRQISTTANPLVSRAMSR